MLLTSLAKPRVWNPVDPSEEAAVELQVHLAT